MDDTETGIFDREQLDMLETMFEMFDRNPRNGVVRVSELTSAFEALTDHLPPTILRNCIRCVENAGDADGTLTREHFLSAMASFTGEVVEHRGTFSFDQPALTQPVTPARRVTQVAAAAAERSSPAELHSPSQSSAQSTVLALERALFEARKLHESLRAEQEHLRLQLKEAAHINQSMTEEIVAKGDRIESLERHCRELQQSDRRYRELGDELERVKAELTDAQLRLEQQQRSKAKLAADLRTEKRRAHLLSMEASQSSDRLNELMLAQRHQRGKRSLSATSLVAAQSPTDDDDYGHGDNDEHQKSTDHHLAAHEQAPERRALSEAALQLRDLQAEVALLHDQLDEERAHKHALEEELFVLRSSSSAAAQRRRGGVTHDDADHPGTAIEMEDDDDDDAHLGQLHPDGGFLPSFDRVESPPPAAGTRRHRRRTAQQRAVKKPEDDSFCAKCTLM
mmetsp:Transcript_13824/g.41652  ORF Transcript_13824/g.41652 Transcript_13824/m.41652 type:complete len:453 (-) Transcript_13824:60-1418(-)|eukprot:CAMPEP_0174230674 /NCGR_PEP_ID=MMETSP0417-20130205/1386_1 /TAXON_ID=242541 /ORGANISM="Mayorella sp, Strain BSH-02190019" /LENGTH=452 /DNA_ID=CAMNT_0015308409 /DNA_START=82 /DNA_END=1440 /DNA_ORIENTATION=-